MITELITQTKVIMIFVAALINATEPPPTDELMMMWQNGIPMRVISADAQPVFHRVGDKLEFYAISPGVTVYYYADFFDGKHWWIYVVVPNRAVQGWVMYDDAALTRVKRPGLSDRQTAKYGRVSRFDSGQCYLVR